MVLHEFCPEFECSHLLTPVSRPWAYDKLSRLTENTVRKALVAFKAGKTPDPVGLLGI